MRACLPTPAAAASRRVLYAVALCCLAAAPCEGAVDVFSNYFKPNTSAQAQALAGAKATLNGLTFNCAVYTILQNTSWSPENITFGDGFARLKGLSSNRLVPVLRAGDPDDPSVFGGPAAGRGFSVRTQDGDLDGASYWMMKWVASQANITLNIDVVRLPGDVYYVTSKNDTAARVIYMLDTMGYDCVLGTVFIQPQRMQFMRYVISHQPYGYQVVTNAPLYVPQSIQERLFKWALPFTRNLWITIACSVVASAILMTAFEHGTEGEDFPLAHESWGRKAARAIYYSAMGVSTVDNFHPQTNEGRMYVAVKAFVFFVIMSSYTAQLTAILANTKVPTQAITSIDSFATAGLPVCVRQNAAQQAFLATFYPGLTVKPIPGLTQAGLLPAIASGVCAGGVGPDPELKYSLGGPGIFDADGFDPDLSFCGLETVGDLLTFGYYGIPFKNSDTPSVTDTTLHAISVLMDLAIDSGNYTLSAHNVNFPQPDTRPQCAARLAALEEAMALSTSAVLQLEDMSGLFIMEGAALVLAVIIRLRRQAAMGIKRRRELARVRAAALSRKLMQHIETELEPGMDALNGEGTLPVWSPEQADDLDRELRRLTAKQAPLAAHHVVGGMEARLAARVAEQSAALAAEVDVLKARMDARAEADAAFQKQVLEALASKKK